LLSTEKPHFLRTRLGLTSEFKIAKFGLRKLGKSLYGTVQCVFWYLEPFRRELRMWQTDGLTRQTGFSQKMLRYVEQPKTRLVTLWRW